MPFFFSSLHCTTSMLHTVPNHQRWYGKMEAQLEYILNKHRLSMHVGAKRAKNVSASELSRKFIKSALLVGYARRAIWLEDLS